MCLLGIGSPLAVAAAIFHIINHATFKAALFMIAGIIDHESGTRDLRKLSGLWQLLPYTATLTMITAAAMAGVPLTNGFLSKEMFFTELVANLSIGHGRFSHCRNTGRDFCSRLFYSTGAWGIFRYSRQAGSE